MSTPLSGVDILDCSADPSTESNENDLLTQTETDFKLT